MRKTPSWGHCGEWSISVRKGKCKGPETRLCPVFLKNREGPVLEQSGQEEEVRCEGKPDHIRRAFKPLQWLWLLPECIWKGVMFFKKRLLFITKHNLLLGFPKSSFYQYLKYGSSKLFYFSLEDNCFTMLCGFLPYHNLVTSFIKVLHVLSDGVSLSLPFLSASNPTDQAKFKRTM